MIKVTIYDLKLYVVQKTMLKWLIFANSYRYAKHAADSLR